MNVTVTITPVSADQRPSDEGRVLVTVRRTDGIVLASREVKDGRGLIARADAFLHIHGVYRLGFEAKDGALVATAAKVG